MPRLSLTVVLGFKVDKMFDLIEESAPELRAL